MPPVLKELELNGTETGLQTQNNTLKQLCILLYQQHLQGVLKQENPSMLYMTLTPSGEGFTD
jgi:hypothetical protein